MSEPSLNRRRRIGAIVAGSIAMAAVIAYGAYRFAPRETPPGQPPLRHLEPGNFAELKSAFNASKGQVRVFALLSPT